jgi:hypothetical protein
LVKKNIPKMSPPSRNYMHDQGANPKKRDAIRVKKSTYWKYLEMGGELMPGYVGHRYPTAETLTLEKPPGVLLDACSVPGHREQQKQAQGHGGGEVGRSGSQNKKKF